jgi:hypothetical protein
MSNRLLYCRLRGDCLNANWFARPNYVQRTAYSRLKRNAVRKQKIVAHREGYRHLELQERVVIETSCDFLPPVAI